MTRASRWQRKLILHADLYLKRSLRWLVLYLISGLQRVSKFFIWGAQRLVPAYAALAYDEKSHAQSAYSFLREKDYFKAFSRGWCYSLAAAGERAGLGDAVCFRMMRDAKVFMEPAHAAIRLPDGRYLDIAGAHQDVAAVQGSLFSDSVIELFEYDAKKEAYGFISERAIWLNLKREDLEKEVDAATAEVLEYWKQSNYAAYPQRLET